MYPLKNFDNFAILKAYIMILVLEVHTEIFIRVSAAYYTLKIVITAGRESVTRCNGR